MLVLRTRSEYIHIVMVDIMVTIELNVFVLHVHVLG